MAGWTFENGGLAAGNVGNAPVYDDVLSSFLGQTYFTPGKYDPALAMTLNAGGQGSLTQGLDAFIGHGADDETNPLGNAAAAGYKTSDLKNLASNFGIDPNSENLEQLLRDRTSNYYGIGGMSAGWNPTGDARQGNNTLYERRDGKLVPIQTNTGVYPEKGNYIQEHPGILAPLAVIGGGLAYGAIGAGAGAGAGAGTAAGEGIGATAGAGGLAGSAPAYMGVGTAGAGAAGEGLTGLGALQGWWAGLPAWQTGAMTGAAQGGISSGLQGKNILQGALMGGLTGGVGAVGGSYLSDLTGMPAWAGRAVTSAGLGGIKGGWQGALGAGLGSLASTGLSSAGVPGSLAGRLGGMAGNAAAGAVAGGSSGAGGSGGAGGGGGMAAGAGGASSSAGGAAGGGFGDWRLPSAADAATATYLKQSYAPIALEAQKKRLAQGLLAEAGI